MDGLVEDDKIVICIITHWKIDLGLTDQIIFSQFRSGGPFMEGLSSSFSFA